MRCAKRARVNAPARQPDHAASSAAAMNNAALRDRLCQHLAACRHAARAGGDRRDPARLAPQRRSRDHRRATRDRSSLRSSARRRARCDRGYLSPYRSRSAPHRHDAPSRRRYRRTRVPGMVDGVHRQSQSAAEAVALVTRSLSSSNANEVACALVTFISRAIEDEAPARADALPPVIRFMDESGLSRRRRQLRSPPRQ